MYLKNKGQLTSTEYNEMAGKSIEKANWSIEKNKMTRNHMKWLKMVGYQVELLKMSKSKHQQINKHQVRWNV